ncbi:MAG: hypothetical protein Q3M24_21585 [Candidatus Electrothrix aestuarii]|uniref:Uncharacterized protein n=1 Tax=Candidatus Electrothrix aestuarii TaxID=3062594 RepID=A0AAU8LUA6_9BACT|nr:hypothetical protein [Candidatus Electrothrix aestuarii]
MLKKILILNAALALSLALSNSLLAGGFTDIGNGLVEKKSDSGGTTRGEMDLGGWIYVGNGLTLDMENGIAISGGIVHVGNGMSGGENTRQDNWSGVRQGNPL